MNEFVIDGRRPLHGEVAVSGAKNAALPIMAASLLTTEECILDNVPVIEDTRTMAELLIRLGCQVQFDTVNHRLRIRAPEKPLADVPADLAIKMRASFLVTGALLARTGKVRAPHPGGCAIGSRPVNVDIKSFAAMGALTELEDNDYEIVAQRLHGERVYLDYPSHTGTENVLMAATLAAGTTIITNASAEPEVVDLANCLRSMGARICGDGSSKIVVEGVSQLGGVRHQIVPDRIEAGTYAIAVAISGGDGIIHNVVVEHMEPLTHKLIDVGVEVELVDHSYHVHMTGSLRPVEVQTLHFPGFPTDLQAAFATLLTQAHGTSVIHERVYDDRLRYASELRKLGARITVSGQTATVDGPCELVGTEVCALDIRSGAALILAGLAAHGRTEILGTEHIERGYEAIDAKLRCLGAGIERVSV